MGTGADRLVTNSKNESLRTFLKMEVATYWLSVSQLIAKSPRQSLKTSFFTIRRAPQTQHVLP